MSRIVRSRCDICGIIGVTTGICILIIIDKRSSSTAHPMCLLRATLLLLRRLRRLDYLDISSLELCRLLALFHSF